MWHYRMSALKVASEIALPAALSRYDAGTSEVLIRRGSISHTLEATPPRRQYLLRVPDVGRFLIKGGQEITFGLDAGVDERDAVVFMLGSAFGILLHQRGNLVLHASAVAVGSGVVIFCGPSRAGKSTLAAALVRQGYPFITDDVCHVGFDRAIDVIETVGRQRRAGRGDELDRRKIMRLRRLNSFLVAGIDVLGRGSKDVDAFGLGVVP